MTTGFPADVLFCGAGAAGLTLAIDLGRRGVSCRMIEKMEGPFRGSRGKGLQPRTLEVFEYFGIADRIAAAGSYYPPQLHRDDDGSTTAGQICISIRWVRTGISTMPAAISGMPTGFPPATSWWCDRTAMSARSSHTRSATLYRVILQASASPPLPEFQKNLHPICERPL
jgi:hypothetical protein